MEKQTEICPWCHTEIVWDEEIGAEELCPHCLNVLGDYRSVPIGDEGLEEFKEGTDGEPEHDEEEVFDDELEQLTAGLEEDLSGDLYQYEQKIKSLQSEQEDIEECLFCHEIMLHAGTIDLKRSGFKSEKAFAGAFRGPIKAHVLMCPACFRAHWRLAPEHRLSIIHHLSNS